MLYYKIFMLIKLRKVHFHCGRHKNKTEEINDYTLAPLFSGNSFILRTSTRSWKKIRMSVVFILGVKKSFRVSTLLLKNKQIIRTVNIVS